jgi:hypothetical protein
LAVFAPRQAIRADSWYGFRSISHEAKGIAGIGRTLIDDAELEAGPILILL